MTTEVTEIALIDDQGYLDTAASRAGATIRGLDEALLRLHSDVQEFADDIPGNTYTLQILKHLKRQLALVERDVENNLAEHADGKTVPVDGLQVEIKADTKWAEWELPSLLGALGLSETDAAMVAKVFSLTPRVTMIREQDLDPFDYGDRITGRRRPVITEMPK